jgi:XTP/dITP diphosphohydrolase
MKEIVVATGNKDKFDEIALALKKEGIESEQLDIEIREDGDNLEEISRKKANEAFAKINKPVIADDTGLFFSAYDNYPGHKAKRIFREIGFEGLSKKLEGKTREAVFKTVICYKDAEQEIIFVGELKGNIATKQGEKNREKLFYDPLFIPENEQKTLSSMHDNEKNLISHRAKATRKFAEWFKRQD